MKETKSSSRASSNGTTVVSHQDDDDDGVEIDRQVVEVRRLVILRKLEQRNREMTERGKTKRVIPLTNKARVEGYIRTVLENDQSEFDDIARTFIVEERDRPLEEIALRLAPDLIHDDLPADMNGTQDWMATSREQLA